MLAFLCLQGKDKQVSQQSRIVLTEFIQASHTQALLSCISYMEIIILQLHTFSSDADENLIQ